MSQQLLQIPRQSDASIIECFKKVGEEFGIDQFSVSAVGYPSLGQVTLSESDTELDTIVAANTALIDTASMNISGLLL